MVTRARQACRPSSGNCHRRQTGESATLVTELIVGIAILTMALLPLAYSFAQDEKMARYYYRRAVAMELVDGEMEILLAGEWHSYQQGPQPYLFHAASATNLPPARTILTISGKHLRLEWVPEKTFSGGKVTREADVR